MSTAASLRGDSLLRVPGSAGTLRGFRAWAVSDGFPRRGRISYLRGELLIDMSAEELETHNKVKSEVGRVVANLAHEHDLGTFYSDRTLLTNETAELSTEPDGTFVTWETAQSGRVRCVPREGEPGEYLELAGTPDWVLEIVSSSSVKKDTELLFEAYHRAEIPEYWLIDARGDEISFRVFRDRPDGYAPVAPTDGWVSSRVFARRFRLERERDRLGNWKYTLRVK